MKTAVPLRGPIGFLLGVALLAGGCAAPLKMRDPADHVAPERLAVLPPFVRSIEIDADRNATEKLEWEKAARGALEPSLSYNVGLHGARYFDAGTLRSLDKPGDLIRWSLRALLEIRHEMQIRHNGHETRHEGVYQWRYPNVGLSDWRDFLDADYLLVSVFFDGQNTTGRSVSNALAMGFGGWVVDARREGFACALNLVNGRIVWCELAPFGAVSVRERGGAQLVVNELTAGLFSMTVPAPELRRRPPPPPRVPAPVPVDSASIPPAPTPSTAPAASVRRVGDPDAL